MKRMYFYKILSKCEGTVNIFRASLKDIESYVERILKAIKNATWGKRRGTTKRVSPTDLEVKKIWFDFCLKEWVEISLFG